MEQFEFITIIIGLFAYLIAAIFYVIGSADLDKNTNKTGRVATTFTVIGFLSNSSTLLIRFFRSGHPPLGNMYEFLLFFIWGIILMYLIVEFKYKIRQVGIFALPLAFAFMIWLVFMDRNVEPLMPALRSNWLYFHVFTAVISYGAFAVSFVVGIMYLLKEWAEGNNSANKFFQALPKLDILDELAYKLILVGMPFLTLVIVTGAIWAEIAWSTYWSWDPKETWSLITWLIYASYLHTRFLKDWRGKRSIIFVVIGFLAVIFTFAGVNILLPGLHSYA